MDAVSGSLGHVETMVNPGLLATIISFDLLGRIGHEAVISTDAIKLPDMVLHDYSQQSIPIKNIKLEWQGKSVTT